MVAARVSGFVAYCPPRMDSDQLWKRLETFGVAVTVADAPSAIHCEAGATVPGPWAEAVTRYWRSHCHSSSRQEAAGATRATVSEPESRNVRVRVAGSTA